MDIPDEAYQAARTALWGRPAGDATLVAQMAVEAAAPIIARTAQVQILREIADEIDGKYAIDAADLRAWADELEQESP